MNIELYNNDCMKILPTLADKSVDLVLTDIPYGEVNRSSNGLRLLDKGDADIVNFDLKELVNQLCRICKGSIYMFCGSQQLGEIRQTMNDNEMTTRVCVWEKTNPSPMNGQHLWLSSVEWCVFGRYPKTHHSTNFVNHPYGDTQAEQASYIQHKKIKTL